jgi:hypothetical protein
LYFILLLALSRQEVIEFVVAAISSETDDNEHRCVLVPDVGGSYDELAS